MNPNMAQHLSQFTGVPARKRAAIITATFTVTVERIVQFSTTSAGSAFTITLPAPEDIPGQEIFLEMTARDGSMCPLRLLRVRAHHRGVGRRLERRGV